MKKILILQSVLTQYRKEFYTLLKTELYQQGIELELIYGKTKNSNTNKSDEVDINWAKYIPNKSINIGKIEILWQPCLKNLEGKDLVIVDGANKLIINYYLMIMRHFSNRKLAFWDHGRNMQENINSIQNKFKSLFINKCDWWFGYTKGTKAYLLANNYTESKITVVQNAIDTNKLRKYYSCIDDSEIDNLNYEFGLKNCSTGIFCGAMYPGKNIDFILETCLRIKKEIHDFHMIFIGSGIESFKLFEASISYDWIHYVGSKFGAERVKYFKVSLIQLMPYYVGLGILDSFAMETPLITTFNKFHGPEIEYLENGINGLITEDNIDDYSQKVIDTLKTKRYINLIEGCKLSSEKYSIETMVENFKNGIIDCLSTYSS